MYRVEVKNACRCFLRDGLPEVQEFQTKEQAQKEAESMLEYMEKNFCKKHKFDLQNQFSTYTIYIRPGV